MVSRGLITSPHLAAAMRRVDRAHYVTRADVPNGRVRPSSTRMTAAYLDSPQYTPPSPHLHHPSQPRTLLTPSRRSVLRL